MKKSISLLFLALSLFSCDQENTGTIYEPEAPYVAFSSSIVPENVLSADNNYSVSVQIVRSNLTQPTTAAVSLETNDNIDGVFDLENSSVTFEEGKGEAYVKIVPLVDASSLDPTLTYVFNLTLTGDKVSELFGKTTYKASFRYTPVGTGNFFSDFFGEQWSVEIEKLEVGELILYKAKDLYETGYNVIIKVEENNLTVDPQPAWTDSDYGEIHITGSGTLDGKVLTMAIEHFVPDLGSFGDFTEILTLP